MATSRLSGQRESRGGADAEDTDRMGDILHGLLAGIFEASPQPSIDGCKNGLRCGGAPGFRKRLKARGDVDAVAVHRAIGLQDDVPKVHANTKPQRRVVGFVAHEAGQFALNCQCGAYRAAGGVEDSEHRISSGIDDSAILQLDAIFKDGASGLERLDSRPCVDRHQARVGHAVGLKDRQEALIKVG